MIIVSLLIWLLAITVAITVHEFAHALVADRLGDPTPRAQGRLSLNPINHYDRVGTTMLLVTATMRALGLPIFPFGWAKPVQFDPFNLKNPRRDAAVISIAGPAINLLLALTLSLILRAFNWQFDLGNLLLIPIITLNVALAFFNLVPVHPLDGGKILVGLLPQDMALEAEKVMGQYGTLILLFLIFPIANGTSPIFLLIGPLINTTLGLLLPL